MSGQNGDVRSSARIAPFAFAGLLIGAALACVHYWAYRRQAIEERYVLLEEVTGMKRKSIEQWRGERLDELAYLTTDPTLLTRYERAAAGDAAAAARVAADFEKFRLRKGQSTLLLLRRDGRPVVAAPPGATRRAAGEEIVFERDVPGLGSLMIRYPLTTPILRMVGFWPSRERGVESALVRLDGAQDPAARAAAGQRGRMIGRDADGELVDTVSERVPGTDWLLVSRGRRAATLAPVLANSALAGSAAASVIFVALVLSATAARRRAEDAVRSANSERALLAQAIEQSAESVVITDAKAVIQYVNPAFSRVTGYSREEAIGNRPCILKSGKHDQRFYAEMWATLARGANWSGRITNRRKDGTMFEEEASIGPVRGPDGAITHYIAVKRDVTNERLLEDQLRQSQKMEAIGRLAGGVAHDFNNILTSILGYAEMASMCVPAGSQGAGDIAEVLKAGKLAAALTRQLLTFSRRNIVEPVTLDLSQPVAALEKMLRRTLGETVRLQLELNDSPLWVRVDPAQIEQIVINLAVNARDAMPRGGLLRIGTAYVELKHPLHFGHWSVPSGRYARLFVADEGTGMTDEVQEHIFEPFFTTKEKGRGTGLGLATVFGIVRQAGGHILVDSAPGAGSAFMIYLPIVAAPQAEPAPGDIRAASSSRGETILLAEDQEEVRSVAARILRSEGYTVLPCAGGDEALAVEAAHRGRIDLLLSDVVMGGMSGSELSEALRARRPESRVLFMSGYTDDLVGRGGELNPGVSLIQKPFTPTVLLQKVRAKLDEPRAS